MKKEDLLQPEIEKILFEMDFIDKYRNIWEKYDKEDENYKVSSKDIITTFQDLNYSVKRKSKEQYFSDFFLLKDLKVSENKVYILDSNHTLHIFEREKLNFELGEF